MSSTPILIVNGRRVDDGRNGGGLRNADSRIAEIGGGLPAHGNETLVDARVRRLRPGTSQGRLALAR